MKTQLNRTPFALLLACASLTGAYAATTYTLTDLGAGGAADINASGKVIGNDSTGGWYFDGTNRTHLAFPAYFPNPEMLPDAGSFPITNMKAVALSDHGRIVGDCVLVGPPPPDNIYGVYYDVGGSGLLLGPVGEKDAFGVNASGEVVGTYFSISDGTNFNTLAGNMATGRAITDAGLVVGRVVVPGTGWQSAASFTGGTNSVLDLGAVGTSFGFRTGSEALSVNASGEVVGYVIDAQSHPFPKVSLPFLYTSDGTIVLGSFGGLTSQAKDINNPGLIVGSSMLPDNTPHAFVFVGGAMVDLNGLVSAGGSGWVLNSANAVNDSGVIVGEGTKDGVAHAFLLTPVAGNLPPAVNAQPVGTNLFAGEAFTLAVTAAGSGPLTYQWQHAGTNVPAATNVTYTVAHATPDDEGGYRVLVTNAFGTTPSDSVTVQVKVLAELQVGVYAGIKITGPVGETFRIEAVDRADDTSWQALGNVTLSSRTFLWVDADSLLHPGRFYRAVLLP